MGNTVLHPIAKVAIQVDCISLQVDAALSETLPVSVPLGTDVSELRDLLGKRYYC